MLRWSYIQSAESHEDFDRVWRVFIRRRGSYLQRALDRTENEAFG